MNVDALRERVILKRGRSGLSLKDVEREAGPCASTIRRFEMSIGHPDIDTLDKLAAWVGMSLSQVMAEKEPIRSEGDTLKAIKHALSADAKLTEPDVRALMGILRAGYQRFTSSGR